MSIGDTTAPTLGARLIADIQKRALRGAALLRQLSTGCICGRLTHLSFEGGGSFASRSSPCLRYAAA